MVSATSQPRSTYRFQPTSEQIALSEERKARKINQAPQLKSGDPSGSIVDRTWIQIQNPSKDRQPQLKVLTWNILAQCLIRRDLFPTSKCLKANQREHMLYREILAMNPDVVCLQEVDRLDKLLPILENAGYAHHYAAGPRKKHGCLIAYKKEHYTIISTKLVEFDKEYVRQEGYAGERSGRSFHTRNIGSLVSLRSSTNPHDGIVLATTHLFWHPKYTYERTRQTGLLIRETVKFRSELGLEGWPCIISGDFNFAPDDPAYSLVVGDVLLPNQEERLVLSLVVHTSVDSSSTPPVKNAKKEENGDEDEDEDEAGDPDKVITNARPANPADGLLSVKELAEFFSRLPRLRSAYDEGLSPATVGGDLRTFADRVGLPSTRHGRHEPEYTSYTHYWKTTLDYIFILDPIDRRSNVVGLLAPHRTADLEPGLPQKDVCGSDHVSLVVELYWGPLP